MKSKSLMLMMVAMGCGLVAAYMTARLTARNNDETERVLVSKAEIKIGTVIKEPEKLFTEMEFRKGTAVNAVYDLEKLKDKIVTRTVRPGQFVVPDDLSSNFGINPPKGTKAMAIKVDPANAVAGFVMPGSRVDVLATIGEGGGSSQNSKPEVVTVLQNQEVLAVDRISMRPDGQQAVETINTVTLAVTPNNAQRLELALRLSGGMVRLLLRDQNDNEIKRLTRTKSISDSGLDFGAGEGGTAVRALAANDDIKPGTVIDDPEKLFHPVNAAVLPDRGYLEADIGKLKGQTIRVPLFKDSFVTVKHFEGKDDAGSAAAKPSAPPPPEPVRHVMFIQNGGKEPRMVLFQDGVIVSSDQQTGGRPTAPPPAPPAAGGQPGREELSPQATEGRASGRYRPGPRWTGAAGAVATDGPPPTPADRRTENPGCRPCLASGRAGSPGGWEPPRICEER
jgi:pilus assembly protein CpaB